MQIPMNILDLKNSEIFVDFLVCRHHRNFWDFGTHFLTFWYWVIFSDILVLPEQKNLECLKIFLTFWYVTEFSWDQRVFEISGCLTGKCLSQTCSGFITRNRVKRLKFNGRDLRSFQIYWLETFWARWHTF